MAGRAQVRVAIIAAGLLLVACVGWMAVQKLRWERHRAIVLCHRVERAAAPGETVLVEDALTDWVLRHYGDKALRAGVRRLRPDGELGDGEVLLVLPWESEVPGRLEREGWIVVESEGELRRRLYFVRR